MILHYVQVMLWRIIDHLYFKPIGTNSYYQLSWGQNRGKHCCSSWCQSMFFRWLGWTQEHKNHKEDAMVYPGSGRSMPYVQQLMTLILKST
jgi:hypothetical protein